MLAGGLDDEAHKKQGQTQENKKESVTLVATQDRKKRGEAFTWRADEERRGLEKGEL